MTLISNVIVFRTDISETIGSGHLKRCLSLAENLSLEKNQIYFFCHESSFEFVGDIKRHGYNLVILKAYDANCLNQQLRRLNLKPSWIVIDQYSITLEWEEAIKPNVHSILVIDDLANRPHTCNILLDQNFFSSPDTRYQDLVDPTTLLLLGPKYALLRDEIVNSAEQLRPRNTFERLLVFFGAYDQNDFCLKFLNALEHPFEKLQEINVIVPLNIKLEKDQISKYLRNFPNLNLVKFGPHFQNHLLRADLYFGSGGSVTWERFFIGLPGIIFSAAENQIKMNIELSRSNLQIYLGTAAQVTTKHIYLSLLEFYNAPEKINLYSKKIQNIVDGKGAKLVATYLKIVKD